MSVMSLFLQPKRCIFHFNILTRLTLVSVLYPVYTDTFYGSISKISVCIIEVSLAIVSHDVRQGISIMYSALQLLAFLSVESRFRYDFAYLNFQFEIPATCDVKRAEKIREW